MISWEELEKEVTKCQRCSLFKTRHNVVFGTGNKNSKIMLIGEAPGYHEDMQGEPFVGAAGQLLDKMLNAIGFTRKDVYIANTIKCRPPNNRVPLPEEQSACVDYLRCQFKLIKPQIIVCLGATAAKEIIREDFKITKERGKWCEKKGIKIIATYHPSALLRDETKKRPAWEDFKNIRKKYDELRNENEQ